MLADTDAGAVVTAARRMPMTRATLSSAFGATLLVMMAAPA
jgi:hypothetical protein